MGKLSELFFSVFFTSNFGNVKFGEEFFLVFFTSNFGNMEVR